MTQQWEGLPNNTSGPDQGDALIYGPEILIRHPQWTASNPRQDIPIMAFTLAEWDEVQQAKLTVGAAPISPSELGRNTTYVFALPARYNYAAPTGTRKWSRSSRATRRGAQGRLSPRRPSLNCRPPTRYSDNGKTFTYTVTSRFSVMLDGNKYPRDSLSVVPTGIVGIRFKRPGCEPAPLGGALRRRESRQVHHSEWRVRGNSEDHCPPRVAADGSCGHFDRPQALGVRIPPVRFGKSRMAFRNPVAEAGFLRLQGEFGGNSGANSLAASG